MADPGGSQTHYLKDEFAFLDKSEDRPGGFIIEKYIRIKDAIVDSTDNVKNSFNDDENVVFDKWINRPGGINNLMGAKPGDGEPGDWRKPHLEGVVNIGALRDFLSELQDEGLGDVNLNKFVNKFDFGIRLCYFPPVENAQTLDSTVSVTPQIKLGDDGFGVALDKAYEELGEKLDFSSDPLDGSDESVFVKAINDLPDPSQKEKIDEISVMEKAFWLQESLETVELGEVKEEYYQVDIAAKTRSLHPTPLITVENPMGVSNLETFTINDAVGLLGTFPSGAAFSELKKVMIESEKYKFLFGFVFPLTRIVSLLGIYNNGSVVGNVDTTKYMFAATQESFKTIFFSLIPGDPWYSKQDERIDSQGGNVGMMTKENDSMTLDGPSSSPSKMKIAIMAASILTKAAARGFDPHYRIMSALDLVGAAPAGMTWGSVPFLYPVNFPLPVAPFIGWGPPLTPLGMAAYSLPLLPGEKKKKKKKQAANEECEE